MEAIEDTTPESEEEAETLKESREIIEGGIEASEILLWDSTRLVGGILLIRYLISLFS